MFTPFLTPVDAPDPVEPRFRKGQQVFCQVRDEVWTISRCIDLDGAYAYDLYRPGYLKSLVNEELLMPVEPQGS